MVQSSTESVAVVPCPFCLTLNRIALTKLSLGPKCGKCQRPILLDRPHKAGGEAYDQSLRGTTVPVLVDFYADWCGPCHMMAPTLDEFARQHAGDALVLKLDTDAEPAIAGRYGIRGIPTLIVFQAGVERGRHVGVADIGALRRLVGVDAG
ncbi:MAG TPA: thioredoxin [Gemmatimonadales bacterium]|nr:thioredoxin [Gemmatimonadales bacterium]